MLVSIGVPTYNRAHLLNIFFEKLLKIVNIFPGKIEILISDDCSTDTTKDISKKWIKKIDKFSKILYNRNNQNIGIANQLSLLLENTSGKYFTVLGDDDYILENGFRKVVEILEKDQAPSAIIQSRLDDGIRCKERGYVNATIAAKLFYEYGNTFMGIVDRKAALNVLNKNNLRNKIKNNIWGHTIFAYLAIYNLRQRPVYIADFEIGRTLSGPFDSQNITNKLYWVRSMDGLLNAAAIIDDHLGINWITKNFITIKNIGFRYHLRTICLYNIIADNTSSFIAQQTLKNNFGFRGKFWSYILYITDRYPKFLYAIVITLNSILHFRSPLFFIKKINRARIDHLKKVELSEKNNKRYNNWFKE